MKKTTKNVTPKNVKSLGGDFYTATINVLGKKYECGGSTVSDAIAGLVVKNPKGKAILTIQHGGVKKDKILMPFQTFRLLSGTGLMKEIALKNISLMFKGV